MTGIESALRALVEDLDRTRTRYALVGGFAVSVRTDPRLTVDVDVAVSVGDDEAAEHVVRALTGLGYVPGAITEHEVTHRLATVRLTHRSRPHTLVDLLFASCGIEPEIVDDAEDVEVLAGLHMPVARTGHLIAMKLLAQDRHRPADYDDLRALATLADDVEVERAQRAVVAIEERGYARGRDLASALAELMESRSGG